MKHLVVEPAPVLRAMTCDRCGTRAENPDTEFFEFISIAYKAGYGSIFGDGNRVEIDLCQTCLKATLGRWIRIREDERAIRLRADLKAFNPTVHGGEWPAGSSKSDSTK